MTYETVKNLKTEDFKRLCGVRPETFTQMVEIVRNHAPIKKKTGRPSKLILEDQVLMTLEYWREYRTPVHIGQSWGVDESTAYRIIRKIETRLSQSRELTLPGKKKLTQPDYQLEIVVIDVTETPIEKPKKNRKTSTVGRRKDTH